MSSGERKSFQTIPKYQKQIGEGIPRHKFDNLKSVDHPDFKRLWALRNWAGKTSHQQFLVQGGRQIEAALDAGYPLLEIWVPERAAWSVAWWEERMSTTCVEIVAAEKEHKLDNAEVKKQSEGAKLTAAAVHKRKTYAAEAT